MESRLRYVYGLDLQTDHVPAVAMQHGDLGSLAIRKRPEQVQVSRLGKAPGYLGFAEEPYVAAPFGRALDGRLQTLGWNSEALRDPVGRHQPRQPPAVGPRSHPELHGVDRLPWSVVRSARPLKSPAGMTSTVGPSPPSTSWPATIITSSLARLSPRITRWTSPSIRVDRLFACTSR